MPRKKAKSIKKASETKSTRTFNTEIEEGRMNTAWNTLCHITRSRRNQKPKSTTTQCGDVDLLRAIAYFENKYPSQHHRDILDLFHVIFYIDKHGKKPTDYFSENFLDAALRLWCQLAPTLKAGEHTELFHKAHLVSSELVPRWHKDSEKYKTFMSNLLGITNQKVTFEKLDLKRAPHPTRIPQEDSKKGEMIFCEMFDAKLAEGARALDEDCTQEDRLTTIKDSIQTPSRSVISAPELPAHWATLCNDLEHGPTSLDELLDRFHEISPNDPMLQLMLRTHSNVFYQELMIASRLACFSPISFDTGDVIVTPTTFQQVLSQFHAYIQHRDSNALFIATPNHHAGVQGASGFCDCNMVAASALNVSPDTAVLIVGFDVNQDNGTKEILEEKADKQPGDMPTIMHLDVFDEQVYPSPAEDSTKMKVGERYTYKPILLNKTSGMDVMQTLIAAIRKFKANNKDKEIKIVLSLGYDSDRDDKSQDRIGPKNQRAGRFTAEDFDAFNLEVNRIIKDDQYKVHVFIEGGYNMPLLRERLQGLCESMCCLKRLPSPLSAESIFSPAKRKCTRSSTRLQPNTDEPMMDWGY